MVGKKQKQKIKTLLRVASFLVACVLAVSSGLSTRQKNQQLAQLIAEYCFPEEVIQDLADLSDRLAQEGKTTRQIRTRIYAEILTLIWVFYIQINIENLWLPKGDRRIDD
jgi:hypothetical protein